jgi:hypothetical protein
MGRQIKEYQLVSLAYLGDPQAAMCCAVVEDEEGWTIVAVSLSPGYHIAPGRSGHA